VLIFHNQGVPGRFPESINSVAAYQYDYLTEGRYPACWVRTTDPIESFAPTCYGNLANEGGEGTVVLWGDSHAACLFPGVRTAWGQSWSIAQFTRDSCPPVLGFPLAENCESGNQFIASMLKKSPKATVILFAAWSAYSRDWTPDSPMGKALLTTIRDMHDAGLTRIIVMGPAPIWERDLPKLAVKVAAKGNPGWTVPSRMTTGLAPSTAPVDSQLQTLLAESPATYFSVLDSLCSEAEGCLVRTTSEPTSFTTWDYGHLTSDGAAAVAARLPLFPTPGGEYRHSSARP
jgi:hypothetical protein